MRYEISSEPARSPLQPSPVRRYLSAVGSAVMVVLFVGASALAQETRSQQPLPRPLSLLRPKKVHAPQTMPQRVKELPQQKLALTLHDCIAEALQRNPGIESVKHLIAAAHNEVTEKRATTLPHLIGRIDGYEVNGSPSTSPFSALNVFDANNFSNRQAHWAPVTGESIGVSYPLVQYGSILGLNSPPVVEAAKAAYNQQQWDLPLERQKLVFSIVSAFSYAVWYRERLAAENKLLAVAQKRLDVIQQRVTLGLALPQTLEDAKSQVLAVTEAAQVSRENSRDATLQLAVYLGRPPNDQLALDASPLALPPLPPVQVLVQQMQRNHPALHVQEDKIRIARQQYRVDRSTRWPTVTLNTSFSALQDVQRFSGGAGHPRPTLFLSELEVEMPLFDFGQRSAAIQKSQEQLKAEQANLKQLKLNLLSGLMQTYNQINELDSSLATLRSDYENAGRELELIKAKRREGMVDELVLLNAQREFLKAKVTLEAQTVMKQLKYAELQEVSGGTWRWIQ